MKAKHQLCKILEISHEDIAAELGITRQAVCKGNSRKVNEHADVLIERARYNHEKMSLAWAAYEQLVDFLIAPEPKLDPNPKRKRVRH